MQCTLQAAELEQAVAERTQHSANAETTLKLKEMEDERRGTALEREHAAKMGSVREQMSALQDQAAVKQPPQADAQSSHAGTGLLSVYLGVSMQQAPSLLERCYQSISQCSKTRQL